MTAWGALADFFKQYTNFRGTSSRRAFNWVVWFWGSVAVIVASIIVVVARLGAFFGRQAAAQTETSAVEATVMLVMMVSCFMSVIVVLPTVALYTRRLHDMGYSGWWQVGPLSLNILFISLSLISHLQSPILMKTWWLPVTVSLLLTVWLSLGKSSTSQRYR